MKKWGNSFNRWGKPIIMGWWPHELIWIDAALCLPSSEYRSALRDIADLTGRGIQAVEQKAHSIVVERRKAAAKEEARRILVAERCQPVTGPARPLAAPMPPSTITPPSRARLMGGRA